MYIRGKNFLKKVSSRTPFQKLLNKWMDMGKCGSAEKVFEKNLKKLSKRY
jgi:hypothetical protein